jgi:phosphoribosylformylglycinamidine synthase
MSRIAVVRFPGSNCETETLTAIARAGGAPQLLDYRETSLGGADAVILPGGFSYGDYLRSGAIARFAPVMRAVQEHAASGGAVIGICNGFQVLCEAHLLPGALLRNAQQRFTSRPVDVRIERTNTVCTGDFAAHDTVRIPVAHGDGRYAADSDTLQRLEREGCIMLRYVAVAGTTAPHNPNGSANDIAGICNAAGTVVGFMPHPERLADQALGSNAGHRFFTSLVQRLALGAAA